MSPRIRDAGRWAWPALVVLAVGLALTSGIGWQLHQKAREIDQKRLVIRIEEVMDQLDARVEKTEQLLQQLDDFLALRGTAGRLDFREWTDRRKLGDNYWWLRGLLVATNVNPSAWEQWEFAPITTSSTNWAAFRAFAQRLNLECQVAFKSHAGGGLRYLDDYDLRGKLSRSTDGNVFSKAAWSSGVRISGQQPIMMDSEGKPVSGILFMNAVHNSNVATAMRGVGWNEAARERDVRWVHLQSMIVAAVDFRRLEQAVWDGKESDLGVEIFSSRTISPETWLNPVGTRPKALDPDFRSRVYLSATNTWKMFFDRFTLFFYTTPLFEAQSPKRLARTVMAAGAGVTVLAAVLVAVIRRARLRQQRMAAAVLEARDALAAAEKERVRLGHDLHDGAIQSLYGIQLGLSRTAGAVENTLPSAARVLEETRARVDEVIVELRRFILARETEAESGPPVSLDAVLASMVDRMRPTTSARLEFESEPGAAARLSVRQAVQLTQLARSALANSLRHSGARRIGVTLREADGKVRLEIVDDGAGFEPGPLLNPGAVNGNGNGSGNGTVSSGTGLRSMRQRVEELGGTLEIDSVPGRGTRLVAEIPIVSK